MLEGLNATLDAFVHILYCFLTLVPLVFTARLFVYDGQMIGLHKATGFLGSVYVLGSITSTLAAVSRALAMVYMINSTGSVTEIQRNIWISSVAFGVLNSAFLIVWHVIVRRLVIEYPKPKNGGVGTTTLLVSDWRSGIALGFATACAILEWGLLAGVSFGTRRIITSGIPFYLTIGYVIWHLYALGGFAYFINADFKRKGKEVY